jgi:hypothetical protein
VTAADPLRLPEVMPLATAASLLGCSVRTLERARDGGDLRASRLAARGCWVVTRGDVLAWVGARAAVPHARPAAAPSSAAGAPVRTRRRRATAAAAAAQRPGPLVITDDMGRVA